MTEKGSEQSLDRLMASEAGRVLVVEDQPLDRDLIRRVLERAGHEVIAVESAAAALQQLEKQVPEVILCDVSMPGMDGLEFCRTVKQRLGDEFVPVLFVTALTRPEHLVAGYEAGAEDYIEKPFDFDELLLRVRAMLRIRRLHEALRHYAARLKSAREETEELLHIVSHDLKAPLMSIAALARQLQQSGDGEGGRYDVREVAGKIVEVTTHALALVEQLAAYGRLGQSKLNLMEVDAGLVVQQAVRNLQPTLQAQSVDLSLPDRWPTLVMDPLAVCQVFQNLIDNAVKYRVPGRPVQVSIGWSEQPLRPGAAGYKFWVADNGRGIPEARKRDVFRLFCRASRDVPGYGVGLAAAARIVERHGGQIGLDSVEGQGTTVWFILPRRPAGQELKLQEESGSQPTQ